MIRLKGVRWEYVFESSITSMRCPVCRQKRSEVASQRTQSLAGPENKYASEGESMTA